MMITLQIKELNKGLNAVNSACEEVRYLQYLKLNNLRSPFAFIFLRHFLLIACLSDTYFAKAKRDYENYSLPGEHIEPRNCQG